jgi:hypothetical protein
MPLPSSAFEFKFSVKTKQRKAKETETFGHKYIRKNLILKELMPSLNIPSLLETTPLAYKNRRLKRR